MRLSLSKRSRYEEFVAANGDELVKLAYAICGDRGRAEDAVQEALTRVYQRWSRLTDPLAYARRTAINATRDDCAARCEPIARTARWHAFRRPMPTIRRMLGH
jgi:DNA-directed RNA polymerase specialized sigma24 family protein